LEEIKKYDVYEDKRYRRSLFTRSLYKGKKFFSEDLVTVKGTEYRAVDPRRSKFFAAIKKDTSQTGLKKGDLVLYLGASHGYTPSFISDVVGKNGFVFALDFAPRVVRDLVFVCEDRNNMAPMLADASKPEEYKDLLPKEVDYVFQDIAQRDQVGIFLKNCEMFLKKEGFGMLAVKARSVDVTKKPHDVFRAVRQELEKHITVVDSRKLDPFEKDHAIFVVKKK
jgi:fibrillarin-like pre-rRNA processing protein